MLTSPALDGLRPSGGSWKPGLIAKKPDARRDQDTFRRNQGHGSPLVHLQWRAAEPGPDRGGAAAAPRRSASSRAARKSRRSFRGRLRELRALSRPGGAASDDRGAESGDRSRGGRPGGGAADHRNPRHAESQDRRKPERRREANAGRAAVPLEAR